MISRTPFIDTYRESQFILDFLKRVKASAENAPTPDDAAKALEFIIEKLEARYANLEKPSFKGVF